MEKKMSLKREEKEESVVFFKHVKCTYRKFQSGVKINETIGEVLLRTAYGDENWISKNKAIIIQRIPVATEMLVIKKNPVAGFIEIKAAADFSIQNFYEMVPVKYPGVPETKYLAVSKLIFAQQVIDSLVSFGHAHFILHKPSKGFVPQVGVKKEAKPKLKEMQVAHNSKSKTCLVCRNSRFVQEFESCVCGERTCTKCFNKRPHFCWFCQHTGGFYRKNRQN